MWEVRTMAEFTDSCINWRVTVEEIAGGTTNFLPTERLLRFPVRKLSGICISCKDERHENDEISISITDVTNTFDTYMKLLTFEWLDCTEMSFPFLIHTTTYCSNFKLINYNTTIIIIYIGGFVNFKNPFLWLVDMKI